MHSLPRCRLLIAFAATLLVAGPGVLVASAQQPRQEAQRGAEPAMRAPQAQAAGRGAERSLSDAVRRVQRETGGRILGAERVPYDGRDINRVKYMDDRGRVRYMDDPAPSRAGPRGPRSGQPPRDDNS
ncbi:MAG: PepSY domain-containing protein [Stenotrophomonas sp.]